MICASSRICTQYPHTRLTLVGKGKEEKKTLSLIALFNLDEKVDLFPWTENMEQHMQAADAFILTSDHEVFGLTHIEAMATQLTIVTMDVVCAGEVIQGGVQALVVPVGDGEALVSAMGRIVTDEKLRSDLSREV